MEQKDIKFSRHAKRRMKLYGISEEDVHNVLRNGKSETSEDGKLIFLHDISGKFKYPVKVVTSHNDNGFVIISTYPFVKRRKNES